MLPYSWTLARWIAAAVNALLVLRDVLGVAVALSAEIKRTPTYLCVTDLSGAMRTLFHQWTNDSSNRNEAHALLIRKECPRLGAGLPAGASCGQPNSALNLTWPSLTLGTAQVNAWSLCRPDLGIARRA